MSGQKNKDPRLLHILVLPFLGEGHINGILRLAHSLAAQMGVVVTFAYPARFYHLAQKRKELTTLLTSSSALDSKLRIQVVEDGLPREEEVALTPTVFVASIPIYQHGVTLLLDDLLLLKTADEQEQLPPPCCIISDTFMPWTQDLANTAGCPRVDFWTSTAAVYSMGSQLPCLVSNGTLPLPKSCWVDVETKWSMKAPLMIEGVPGLPPFLATDLPKEFVRGEQLTEPDLQIMLATFSRVREAHTIFVHSLYELESPVFDALQAAGLPIHAVGPLPDRQTPISPSVNTAKHQCLHWLDAQPPSSVIYVALGSIAKLTPSEMHALALALEASKHPFLWVVRSNSISSPLSDSLPPGFLHRTVDQASGLIIPWAPQTQVLSHPSIGAFFSHCGWNSTLECMWEGVPMVACPRAGEQRSNARWIVDTWKTGVALERQQDGSFTQEAVERALQELLSKERKDGVDYKERALHAKEVARRAFQEGGSSHANLRRFLQNLR